MSHAFHDVLPGFDVRNIWHDGCEECEARAASPLANLSQLDHKNFRQAWADMLAAKGSGGAGLTRRVSGCDYRLMNALYAIAVALESNAGQDPRVTLATIEARSEELEARLAEMFGSR